MRKILSAALIMTSLDLAMPASAEENEVKWVADIPIMPSLEIEPGLGFAYENREGRIVMIYLRGGAKSDEIINYYNAALEPLGWKRVNETRWQNAAEVLEISKTEALSTTLWKIMLLPN